jgi:hypothetical protein
MSAPDPADAPYARCLLQHPAAERIVNFDLDWTAINFGQRGTAPAVHITIRGPDGADVIAQLLIGPVGDPVCRVVRSFFLSSEPPHSGQEYLLTLAVSRRTPLRRLSVWVDGHPLQVRLIRVCPKAQCYHVLLDMPPLFTPGTPYSQSLTL